MKQSASKPLTGMYGNPAHRAVGTTVFLMLFCGAGFLNAQHRAAPAPPQSDPAALQHEIEELRGLVLKLQTRVDELEKRAGNRSEDVALPVNSATQAVDPLPATESAPATRIAPSQTAGSIPESGILRGTTFNFSLDGYYGYNFNAPVGRDNLLRAYDVTSDAFSLNQANVVVENAPDLANGKRFGGRLDLQWGQATQTLQGNAANEPRPEIYRAIFQAYGTYIVPVGNGLTVDAGKWASSLGIEGNYTKDQIDYSRSFWFDFLPFYHMGLRVNYKFNNAIGVSYWIVNGAQQTEPFNGFKDELFGLALQPRKNLTWTVNYYLGMEHPDTIYFPNGIPPGAPQNLPETQGVPFEPVSSPPTGRLHIIDSYFTWRASPKLTIAGEGDYVIERLLHSSPPLHTDGGAAYARYQFTPKIALGARTEYLSDRGGLYTGATQAVKETTFTTEYRFSEGFLARGEWRRDFSNRPYFLTSTLGILKKEQNTATVGLVWWFGTKQGAW